MTKRTATVVVKNETGEDVVTIHVGHKYSDNFKNQKDFAGKVKHGQTTNDKLTVEYNTGAFTTGRDWWYVAFTMEDGSFYQSNPQNFREFVDVLEKAGSYAKDMISDAISSDSDEAAAAAAIGNLIANNLMNNESTAGFKQHILRSEDEGRDTTIVIRKDQVIFKSKSGDSKTGVKKA